MTDGRINGDKLVVLHEDGVICRRKMCGMDGPTNCYAR